MKAVPLEVFCEKVLNIYTPGIPEEDQCRGYKDIKYLIDNGLRPFPLKEIQLWETSMTRYIFKEPDIRYLRSLHPLLREIVVQHWEEIEIRLPFKTKIRK